MSIIGSPAADARDCVAAAVVIFAFWIADPLRLFVVRFRARRAARRRGRSDRRAGVHVGDNPFTDVRLRDAWLRGWSGAAPLR